MVWLLSLALCLMLLLGMLMLLFPQLVLPFVADHWRRGVHYRNH